MVVTATAAAPALAFWQLAAVFTVVPAACLILWSASGAALSRLLARPAVATWFDRSMGALLVASAVALAVQS
jgi:threonine/homoserine/homoserine lactone efflux protein